MKKRVFIVMTIAALLILGVSLLTGCGAKNFALQASQPSDFADEAYARLTYVSNRLADRTASKNGDKAAAIWLAEQLSGMGYAPAEESNVAEYPGLKDFVYNYSTGTEDKSAHSYNVLFRKAAATESKGEIVLAAQYDNAYAVAYNNGVIGSDGAYESGAAIAVLLTVAERIKDFALEYDLTIAFFGAGTYGFGGAYDFYNGMNAERVDNIALFVNYGNLVGGDATYAYAQDKRTDYGDFFDEVAAVNDLPFAAVPADKRTARGALTENAKYGYFHIGMIGNHMYFMNADVPTLHYLSLAWDDYGKPGNTEIKGKDNVFQTADDTFNKMVERVGEDAVKQRLNAVVAHTVYALESANAAALGEALGTARAQLPGAGAQSNGAYYGVSFGLKAAAVAAVVALFFVFRKRIGENREKYMAMLNRGKPEPAAPVDVFGLGGDSVDTPADGGDNDRDDNVFDGF